MKKLLASMLALSMLLIMATGCSTGDSTQPATDDTQTQPEAADAQPDATGEEVTLVIESWRADDIAAWEDTIIPAFEAANPGINVEFNGVINTEYGTTLQTKFSSSSAGDLIMVEPYDFRANLYTDGNIAKLNDVSGVNTDNFEQFALDAWSTDDGDIFGVPLASALHGYIYNKTIFDELGLSVPTTNEEFFAVLETIKNESEYVPIAMGTGDEFVNGVMAMNNIMPAFINGEEGRLGLISGEAKFTDPEFVEAFQFVNDWVPYMPDGFEAITYADLQNLFIMGQAAIYPAGSWEIPIFAAQIGDTFEYGAFAPTVRAEGDKGYINNHPDMGMALNANAAHPDEAKKFLEWMTTAEFAEVWNTAMPGFYSLLTHEVTIENELANEFLSFTTTHGSSPRVAYQIISRGTPNTDAEINRLTGLMLTGSMTPEEVTAELQAGLDSWYTPAA